MRVSILTATSAWGGAENHAVNLARVMKKRGHEARIVELGHTVYDRYIEGLEDVEVVHVPLATSLEKVTFKESFKLLRNLASDIGVFEKGEMDSANWRFDFAARVCFKRYVSIEQLICNVMPPKPSRRQASGFVPGINLWWYQTYWNRVLRSLGPHSVVCVSHAVRTRLLRDYRFSPRKTITIHNGIDTSKFRPDKNFRAAARRGWGIANEDMVLGALGRFAPVKGYDIAIKAFKKLKSDIGHRRVWLVLIGDGPARADLEHLVKENGLEDTVKLPGSVERPWEIYPAFDAFLMPSLLEGLPHALLEAMASECPPIAVAVGGIPEVITGPDMGWLIPERDRDDFFAAMTKAVTTPAEKLTEMGRRARQHVMSNFDSNVLLGRLADVIEFGSKGYKKLSHSVAERAVGAAP